MGNINDEVILTTAVPSGRLRVLQVTDTFFVLSGKVIKNEQILGPRPGKSCTVPAALPALFVDLHTNVKEIVHST